jgi:hypothetical protein
MFQILVHQAAFMEAVQYYQESRVGAGVEYDHSTPECITIRHALNECLTVAGMRELGLRVSV